VWGWAGGAGAQTALGGMQTGYSSTDCTGTAYAIFPNGQILPPGRFTFNSPGDQSMRALPDSYSVQNIAINSVLTGGECTTGSIGTNSVIPLSAATPPLTFPSTPATTDVIHPEYAP
jgi:hypothetical protein